MKKPLLFLLAISLLCSCGGTSSGSSASSTESLSNSDPSSSESISSSSSSSASVQPLFDEGLRQSLTEVTQKYANQAFGQFKRFHLLAKTEDGRVDEAFADMEKRYYGEKIDGAINYAIGDYYCYYLDGDYYEVQDAVYPNGSHIQGYRYLTEEEYREYEQTTLQLAPYQAVPAILKPLINATDKQWKDAVFAKKSDDGKGNISISLTAKQFDTSAQSYYADEGKLEIEIKDYLITRILITHQGEYTFDVDEFEPVYPDLSELPQIGPKPKAPIVEEPLSKDDFLIDEDNHRTYYQLLVYSFADSDGDGIGDFKGIADKLDYLQSLGIEGLWLSPILKASSYHGYDIEDYYTINTAYEVTIDGVDYGINYLLKECHKRNIKVLMDLVLNHTSDKHVWRSEHPAWYGNDNRFGFPEFNFTNEGPRKAVTEVGKYWLERGFDGFRLDAAMWLFNSGKNRHQKNYEFWQEWCGAMKEAKPDCYLIGEVLDSDHDLAYSYAEAGFDSTFDFNALGNVIGAVDGSDDYAAKTQTDIDKAFAIDDGYILGRPLSNHDIGRFNQEHPDSSDKAYYVGEAAQIKMANAINVLTPGNAFVYYGDELGLLGTAEDTKPDWYYDMNYRTAMPWKDGRCRSVTYFGGFHGSGVTTSTAFSGKTAEEDVLDKDSIFTSLQGAIKAKNGSEILQKGRISAIQNLAEGLSGFDATYQNETIRVVWNSTDDTIDYSIDSTPIYSLAYGNGALSSFGLVAFSLS